jgi:superoxide dismutase, Fe-Mn family
VETTKSSRRVFLKRTAVILPACAVLPGLATSLAAAGATSETQKAGGGAEGPYVLPPLGYPYDALEPHIDRQTMEIHHDKHHAAYVKSLNTGVQGHPDIAGKPLEQLLANLDTVPEAARTALRNFGGGHLNHSFFWETMAPGGSKEPKGALADAIKSAFGGLEGLKKEFNEAGMKRFGSGWAWLVLNPAGRLEVLSTANQDSPLSIGKKPLMVNDVWEHAYYLKYRNLRGDYLAAWWNVVNWDKVAERFGKAG